MSTNAVLCAAAGNLNVGSNNGNVNGVSNNGSRNGNFNGASCSCISCETVFVVTEHAMPLPCNNV